MGEGLQKCCVFRGNRAASGSVLQEACTGPISCVRTVVLLGGLQGPMRVPGLCSRHRQGGVSWPTDPTAPLPPTHHSPSPRRWGCTVPFTKDKPEPQGAARVRVQSEARSASNVVGLVFPPTAGVVDEGEPSVWRPNGTQVSISFRLRWKRQAVA